MVESPATPPFLDRIPRFRDMIEIGELLGGQVFSPLYLILQSIVMESDSVYALVSKLRWKHHGEA